MSDGYVDTDEFAPPRWQDEVPRALPQKHCQNQTDHDAHTHGLGGQYGYRRCPGRYTPSKYRAPADVPAVPADPFALIPGARCAGFTCSSTGTDQCDDGTGCPAC